MTYFWLTSLSFYPLLSLFAIFSSPSCLRLHFGGSEQRPRFTTENKSHLCDDGEESLSRLVGIQVYADINTPVPIHSTRHAAARCLSIVAATRSDNIPEGICLLKTLQATVPPPPPLHSLPLLLRDAGELEFFPKKITVCCAANL